MSSLQTVQSLDRGLTILELVARQEGGMRLAELSAALGLQPPTVHNLAQTLVRRRFLEKTRRPIVYRPGSMLRDLIKLSDKPGFNVEEALKEAAVSLGHPANVTWARWSGGEIILVHAIDYHLPDVLLSPQTPISNPYSFASSLALLAFMSSEDREHYLRRYPFGEYGEALWKAEDTFLRFLEEVRREKAACPPSRNPPRFALPIFDRNNVVIAALGVCFPVRENSPDETGLTAAAQSLRELLSKHQPDNSHEHH